jgi:hypothetical protein
MTGITSSITSPITFPITSLIAPYGPVVFDGAAAAYISAVEAADGQALEPAVKLAINAFVVGCMADASPNPGVSNWDAMKATCLMAGARTLAGALVPMKGTAPTNFNFVSGNYTRSTGLKGDGTTKYLDLNRAGNADPQNNFSITSWVSSAHTIGGQAGANMGNGTLSGAVGSNNIGRSGANPANLFGRARSASAYTVNGSGDATGFVGVMRNSDANWAFRAKGADTPITEASSTARIANILGFKIEDGAFTDARIAMLTIGEAVNMTLLDARITTYMAAIAGIV